MGIFTTRKRPKRRQRIEPHLFASRAPEPAGKRRKKRRSLAGVLFSVFLLFGFWGTLAAGLGFGYIWLTLDAKGLLQIPAREPGIMLLAADGGVLAEQGAFYGDEVRLGDLPDYVPNAVIAIEDRRFRSHWGVDPQGLIRAAYENFRAGRVVQGGSTISQQLAKNLFLEPDRTYWRKAQEMVLAIWLETRFTKDEILQLYLNRVYFGGGATGIEKAAQAYYRKSANELSLAEAATLAGLLKAPSTYNPATHPEAATERARLVLASMAETGAISANEAARAIDNPAEVVASNYVPAKQYVADWVIEQLPEFVRDYDQSIVVETTIDPSLQFTAEKSLRRHLAEEGVKLDVTQAAFVMLDTSGAIKAMVGGRSYKKSQFNRATKAKRQPGSAFKPFVYLAAIEQGYTPDSVEIDEPVRIGNWEPENYKRKYLGPVTLETAFALSLNTISAKLTSYVGPESVGAVAHRLGIASPLGRDASIALGTSEVTLLEMTAAFTPFANGGAPVAPFAVRRVLNRDGVVLYERNGDGLGQAVSIYDVGSMNRLLRAVVTEGTGRRAQFGGFDLGGKTGTSQDYRDAWFIGYSSHLVAGVWAGNDDNSPTRKVTGGSIPAAIWKDVMEEAHMGLMPQPLPGADATGYLDGVAMLPGEQDLAGLDDGGSQGGLLDTIGGFFGGGEDEMMPPQKQKKRKKKWWEGKRD
jgi:penicillin-binding protein 1A